ncbi:MAG TPA: hypothetical protein VHM28_07165 [Anaerolineales bacterium]|nr:hypothetical protein [Anaerolineales bacterium]
MLRKFFVFASFAGLLSGCILAGVTSAPTPYPADYIPTVIYLTAESISATESASITPSPIPTETFTPIPPTLAPTDTLTPVPGVPLAAIQIDAPGPASKIASPLEVRMTAIAGKSHVIEVDLFGEDGRLLGRTLRAVQGYPAGDYLFVKIPFEIRAAAENGWVQVSTKDGHGRVQSLVSVQVLLVSSGSSQINPAGNAVYERVNLYQLPAHSVVSGGVLDVEGEYKPVNHQPVILELISDDGQSLGLRVLNFTGLDPQPFKTTIPYKVTTLTAARLFVHQADDVLTSQAYIYSQEITLDP